MNVKKKKNNKNKINEKLKNYCSHCKKHFDIYVDLIFHIKTDKLHIEKIIKVLTAEINMFDT